jgi:lipopolysaccharide export LptBFGC system permease protein LptF
MLKLYRVYLASSFIMPLLVSTLFFVAFMLTFEIFKVTKLLVNQDVGILFILGLVGDIALTMLPMAIPIAIYFSILFCMNKLSGDSEYVALRAAGIDKKQLVAPFMIIAVMVAISLFFIGQQIVPEAQRSLRHKIVKLSSGSLIAGLQSGQFFTTIPSVTIFPEKYDEQTGDLESIFLHVYNKGENQEKIIFANEGKLIHEKNDATGIETLNLLLIDGNISNISSSDEGVEKIIFQNYLFPMTEKRYSFKFATRETMMNLGELKQFIDDGLESALKKGYKKKDYFNARYEFWNRMVTPLVCIVLTLLGFCLGVKGNRSHSKNGAGKAILYLVGYFFLYFGFVSVARGGKASVPLMLMIAPTVFGIIAIRFFKKIDWHS